MSAPMKDYTLKSSDEILDRQSKTQRDEEVFTISQK